MADHQHESLARERLTAADSTAVAMDESKDCEDHEVDEKKTMNNFAGIFNRLTADNLIPMLSTADVALLRGGGSATLEKKMAMRNIGREIIARKEIYRKVQLLLNAKFREGNFDEIRQLTENIIGKDQELASGRGRLFGSEISTLIVDIFTKRSERDRIDRGRFYRVIRCLVANSGHSNNYGKGNQWQLSPAHRIRILCTSTSIDVYNTDKLLYLGLLDGVDFASPQNRSAILLGLGCCLLHDGADEWAEKVLGILASKFDMSTIDARSVNCFWRLGNCIRSCRDVWPRLDKLSLHFTDTAVETEFQLESIWNKHPPFVLEETKSNSKLELEQDPSANLDSIVEPLLKHLQSEVVDEASNGNIDELDGNLENVRYCTFLFAPSALLSAIRFVGSARKVGRVARHREVSLFSAVVGLLASPRRQIINPINTISLLIVQSFS